MPSRFHCPLPLSLAQDLLLPAEVAHHAVRVLRLRYGETVVVFDGAGTEYLGELIEVGPTTDIFMKPKRNETEDYITGRFG